MTHHVNTLLKMDAKEKEIIIRNTIKKIDSNKKIAKMFFKAHYDYDNEKEDFKEWFKLWKLKSDSEKFEEAGKGLYGKDFDKVFNALQTSRGNPFKAYKLLKEMKKDELRH